MIDFDKVKQHFEVLKPTYGQKKVLLWYEIFFFKNRLLIVKNKNAYEKDFYKTISAGTILLCIIYCNKTL